MLIRLLDNAREAPPDDAIVQRAMVDLPDGARVAATGGRLAAPDPATLLWQGTQRKIGGTTPAPHASATSIMGRPLSPSSQTRLRLRSRGMPKADKARDEKYLEILLKPLRVCLRYKPMFGRGRKGGMSVEEFQSLYRGDAFYSWMGLDSPLMYAAHKAAGGMTSIYRQVGIGGQYVFQRVLRDALGLADNDVKWSYTVPTSSGKEKTLTLDGRIPLDRLTTEVRARVTAWLTAAKAKVVVPRKFAASITGAVFEVRQGYKSKDSKRQNADIENIYQAYLYNYLPVVLLLSTQIDGDVAERYTENRCLLLLGTTNGTTADSSYRFCREVVGYDLAGFFERNSPRIKQEMEGILKALLSA